MITSEQFHHLFPRAQDPTSWAESMCNVFPTYDITTPKRVAAFLAQCGHESGGWTVFEENLNYSAQGLNGIFKKYFPTLESAQPYARKPEMIAKRSMLIVWVMAHQNQVMDIGFVVVDQFN